MTEYGIGIKRRVAAVAVVAVVMFACLVPLLDDAEGESGTEDDPYTIWWYLGTEGEFTISPVGMYTIYRAIDEDITIAGVTFTTDVGGTFDTLTTTASSAGQTSSLVIAGTPTETGTWNFYAFNGNGNETYYTIIVYEESGPVVRDSVPTYLTYVALIALVAAIVLAIVAVFTRSVPIVALTIVLAASFVVIRVALWWLYPYGY